MKIYIFFFLFFSRYQYNIIFRMTYYHCILKSTSINSVPIKMYSKSSFHFAVITFCIVHLIFDIFKISNIYFNFLSLSRIVCVSRTAAATVSTSLKSNQNNNIQWNAYFFLVHNGHVTSMLLRRDVERFLRVNV